MLNKDLGVLLMLYAPLVIVVLYTAFNRKDRKQGGDS